MCLNCAAFHAIGMKFCILPVAIHPLLDDSWIINNKSSEPNVNCSRCFHEHGKANKMTEMRRKKEQIMLLMRVCLAHRKNSLILVKYHYCVDDDILASLLVKRTALQWICCNLKFVSLVSLHLQQSARQSREKKRIDYEQVYDGA